MIKERNSNEFSYAILSEFHKIHKMQDINVICEYRESRKSLEYLVYDHP